MTGYINTTTLVHFPDKNRKKRSSTRRGHQGAPRHLDEKDQKRQPSTLKSITFLT